MADSLSRWSPLEHQIYNQLRKENLQGKKFLLAVSGGADSVALFHIFRRLHKALDLTLEVVSCHHGPVLHSQDPASSQEQELFRDRAGHFVKAMAVDFPFHSVTSSGPLKSENEMRDFRKREIEKIRSERACDFSVWAHHLDDFLETQVLRMIRGAAPESVFEPMLFQRGFELRPFLRISKSEIQAYLHERKLEWIEDPSNQSENYLRNWLRRNWLPQLEEKCPGALRSLARSLDMLQDVHRGAMKSEEKEPEDLWRGQKSLSRPTFLVLNLSQKKQVLARYMRNQGQMNFTNNHIEEILKHLDISQLNHTFRCAGLEWELTEDLISVKGLLL